METLQIVRTFDATPEKVYEAWTDAAQLAKWMGPGSVEAEIHECNAVEGGAYSLTMHSEKGDHPLKGVYKVLDKPHKIVMTWQWEENEMIKEWTNETTITVELKEVDGKTEMTFTHENLFNEEAKESHMHGWNGSFEKLAGIL